MIHRGSTISGGAADCGGGIGLDVGMRSLHAQHLTERKAEEEREPDEELSVSEWVRLCAESEAPKGGEAGEFEAAGVALCVANRDGQLHAVDNWCPHRQGPLGQGWLEGNTIVCPWHAWAFNLESGVVDPPESGSVAVFPVRIVDGNVMVNLG